MSFKSKISFFLLTILILSLSGISDAVDISEKRLRQYSSRFFSKLIKDNKKSESKIRECLNVVVSGRRSGIRLLDKFGMFLFKSAKQGICLNRAMFFYGSSFFCIFMVMEDDYDGQVYTLYIEYRYNSRSRSCALKDIYFSLVFEEKMKEIKKYFGQ